MAPKLGKRTEKFWAHVKAANEGANPELMRIALKLATGAGKTTVMAMLIAWQTVNAVRYKNTKSFSRGFLIVTPGITIRDRLRVLMPNDPESYYSSPPIARPQGLALQQLPRHHRHRGPDIGQCDQLACIGERARQLTFRDIVVGEALYQKVAGIRPILPCELFRGRVASLLLRREARHQLDCACMGAEPVQARKPACDAVTLATASAVWRDHQAQTFRSRADRRAARHDAERERGRQVAGLMIGREDALLSRR